MLRRRREVLRKILGCATRSTPKQFLPSRLPDFLFPPPFTTQSIEEDGGGGAHAEVVVAVFPRGTDGLEVCVGSLAHRIREAPAGAEHEQHRDARRGEPCSRAVVRQRAAPLERARRPELAIVAEGPH